MSSLARCDHTAHPAPQPRPSDAAGPHPSTPTPPPSHPERLLALLLEADELVVPLARAAVEQLGYAVVSPGAEAAPGDGVAVAEAPATARFVGVHGFDGVVSCRFKHRLGFAGPQAIFTIVYAVRDEAVAVLHRLHRCADVVAVLRDTGAGPRLQHVPWPSRFENAGITAREADVLALLLARRTNAEIAEALVISPATVRAHCRSVFSKLGTGGRRELWERFDGHEGRVA